ARKGFRPQTWRFEWNPQDQLVLADGPLGRWRYGYDPFGRRIYKECQGRREDFLWDGDVIARAGEVDWFFEPDSFRPMARHEAGALFHIVNDHLGTPKEMFSEGGALAWAVDHDTWGTVRLGRAVGAGFAERGDYWVEPVSFGAEAPAYVPAPAASFCPIRFQGQWEDPESGLYYNRFRYYEPLAGQYASPDPIGLLGGGRIGYVEVPSIQVDMHGLASSCCVSIDERQLQKKYKHASDFGINGPYNKSNADAYAQAVQGHVSAPSTQQIIGTYRGDPVIHYLDPKSGLNVITDTSGNFLSGWKLNPGQLQNVIGRGSL
ncbi:MAG: colicin D domain-containing protein, partial [Vibrio fluvialis]